MPIAIRSDLHAFERLRTTEQLASVVDIEEASRIDLPVLHVGFVNMMPDAAVEATERQFLRLLHAGAQSQVIHVHPISIGNLKRHGKIGNYVDRCYTRFRAFEHTALDALLLSGANPQEHELTKEPFWDEFVEIIEWGRRSVKSVLCSCLATHGAIQHFYGITRTRCVDGKRWGVFDHHLTDEQSSLTASINKHFKATHSHVYEMTAKQLADADIRILATSAEADFHIATSSDGLKWVYLQGHPEYDSISLLKEFKREIALFAAGKRQDYPPYPRNYFPRRALAELERFRSQIQMDMALDMVLADFPEGQIAKYLPDSVDHHGKVLFTNWLNAIGAAVR